MIEKTSSESPSPSPDTPLRRSDAPVLLTLDEVAARLHVSRRWLQGFLKGRPFGRMAGRKRLFTEDDFVSIINALPCPSSSSPREPGKAKTTRSGGRISGSALIRLRERLTKSSANTIGRRHRTKE